MSVKEFDRLKHFQCALFAQLAGVQQEAPVPPMDGLEKK
jgi:hypothetical protein